MEEIKEIDKELLIKILQKSCGFKINKNYVDIFDSYIAEINSFEGFNFVQTGSGYYFSENGDALFPVIDYEFSFDRRSTLDYYDEYPYIFQGKKFIIPLVFTKTGSINERNKTKKIIEKIEISGLDIKKCIITEISSSVKGNSLENFVEYVTSRLLIEKGFLVENQVFFSNLEPDIDPIGVPDIGVYKNPELQNRLIERRYIEQGGFIKELALLRIFGLKKKNRKLKESENNYIIGEAKTGSAGQAAFKEKEKYFNWGCFHRFLQITPHQPVLKKWYDHIKFYPNGKVVYLPSENPKERTNWHKQRMKIFEQALVQKVKFYLLKNLNLSELLEFLEETPKTFYRFYRKFISTDLEEIFNFLEGILS